MRLSCHRAEFKSGSCVWPITCGQCKEHSPPLHAHTHTHTHTIPPSLPHPPRHSKDYGETYITSQNPTGWRGSSIVQAKVHPWHDDWLLIMVKRPGCTSVDMVMTKCE
jgi:hypothetical protein